MGLPVEFEGTQQVIQPAYLTCIAHGLQDGKRANIFHNAGSGAQSMRQARILFFIAIPV